MPLINSININITDRCNLKCPYCFYAENLNNHLIESPLSLKGVETLLSFFEKIGVKKINLTGGEPTLSPKNLLLLLELSKKNGFETSMITNCTRIIEKCGDYLDHVIISIDGKEESMFKNRNVRDYGKIIENIGWYSKNIRKISVNMVVSKQNLHSIHDDMKAIQNLFEKDRISDFEVIRVSTKKNEFTLNGLENTFIATFLSSVANFNTTTQFKHNLEKCKNITGKLDINEYHLPIWFSLRTNEWYLVESNKFEINDFDEYYVVEKRRVMQHLKFRISECLKEDYVNPYDYLF